ncbi:MAG TPA: hypothetical protein VD994_17740, partial [Prosthecobacter sp.]|nr:hypothetical protein [Prosthecobacter sp.]
RLLALLPARLSTEPADVVIRYGSLFLLYGLNLAPVGPDDDRGLRQIETALGLIEDTLMNESRPGDAPPGQTEAMLAPKGQIIGWSRMQTLTRVGTGFVLNKQTVPDYFMEHRRLATPSQFLIDALAARPASAEIRRRYARCIARLAALEGLEDQAVQWAEKAAS